MPSWTLLGFLDMKLQTEVMPVSFPMQISFRNLNHDPDIEHLIKDKASKLDRFSKEIISCRVVVEVPHRHHLHGNAYSVMVDVSVPGKQLVINHENADELAGKGINAALKDAFDAAERQLEDYAELKRH